MSFSAFIPRRISMMEHGQPNRRFSLIVLLCLVSAMALWTASCSDDPAAPGTTPGPAIGLSVRTLGFSAAAGGGGPLPQSISVTNKGKGTLSGLADTITYADGEPTGWLSATLGSATAPTDLTLEAASWMLPAGTYTANVVVTADDASNDPQNLIVTLRVYARYGIPNEFASGSSHSPNYLLGSKITVAEESILTHLCLIAKAGGPQAMIGLYRDESGNPGPLLASTSPVTLVPGRMEIPVADNIRLSAGDYWVMVVYNAMASVGWSTANASAVVKYISLPFGSALPDPFPAPATYTGQEFNYYIRAYVP